MLQRTLKMTPRWLDLGWIGLDTPFLLSLSLLQQRDVLSGKWIVGAVMNVITHPSGPRSQGWKAPTKYYFLSKYFFQLTSWPRPSKWQNGKDAKMVLWISHWWSSEVLTKLFVLVTDLMNAEQVLADCEPKSGTTTNFRDKYCNILGSLNAIHIATILRSPKTSVKPDTLDTIYIYNGKSLSVSFWMQDTMGGVSIVNIVWQKYFYSPA